MTGTSTTPVRRRPWGLTCFSLLAIAALAAMPVIAGEAGERELPNIIRFLGHFHPVVLHLPIGVFILIVCQELGSIFFRRGRAGSGESLFPLFFGAASAIVAVIAGFLLYHGHADDYRGQELAERHLWGGLAFAILAVLTFILKAWTFTTAANPAWYRLLLFVSVAIMGFASHDGASMTHGSDYLTRYAPAPLRKMLGLEPPPPPARAPAGAATDSADPVLYTEIVAPILERRCVQCHKPGKTKGKLRMDTFEMLVKGGAEGPAIEPGNAAKSNIIVRIELAEDDDEHMPPDGKPDIEPYELAVLKWWIDSGADPARKLGEFEVPVEIEAALVKLGRAPEPVPSDSSAASGGSATAPPSNAPDAALKSAVAALATEFPGALSFESPNAPWVTFTGVSLRGKLDDAGFAKLAPVLPRLTTVDLSATGISDASVAALAAASHLRQLRLAETSVTDAAIDALLKIETLESINLYGTKVTDVGVAKLAALPNLKRLYLWQTAVTPDALNALKNQLPGCEIITGQ